MPPLVVQGVFLTADGQPIADQTLTIVLSNFYAQSESFKALTSGDLDTEAQGYQFCTVRSSPGGEFSCRLPGESRYIGFMPPLMCPSENTLRSYVVGLRTAGGSTFAVSVYGAKAEVRVPKGPDFKLVKPSALPLAISAAASRSEHADVLQLVLRVVRPAA